MRLSVAVGRWWLAVVFAGVVGLVGVLAPSSQASESSLEVHVSPTGSDAWAGSAERPFASLQRAQRAVRGLTAGMDRDVVVNLHAGVHRLARPLSLRDEMGDSGENGHRVVYQSYGYALGDLSAERSQLTGSKGSLEARLERARAEVADIRARLARVKGQRKDVAARLADIRRRLSELRSRLRQAKSQAERRRLQRRLRHVRKLQAAASRRIRHLRRRQAAVSAWLSAASGRQSAISTQLSEVVARLSVVDGRIALAEQAGRDDVVVSGGRQIDGWQLDDAEHDVWRAEVGPLDTRQLYVAGQRATRARLDGGEQGGIPGDITQTETGYVTTSTAPQEWTNPDDIEFVYHAQFWWTEPRCGVAEIAGDAESTTITMEQPCFRWFKQNHQGDGGGGWMVETVPPTHVENSGSFLTEPGTFYLDRSVPGEHVLLYVPRPGEDLQHDEVVAPVLEHLVLGAGMPGEPLHDVTLRGLTFSHATWMGPSDRNGFSQVFGPIYEGGFAATPDDPFDSSESARSVPGNVAFRHSERIAIEGSRFVHLGGAGVELSLGTSDSVIEGNLFTDISEGGIQVGSRQPDTDLDRINRGNVVENNLVHGIGAEYKGSIGIYAEKTQRVRIAHNQVNDVPYTGIAFGEFWTHYAEGQTVASGNRILDNRVFDTLTSLYDGGGIWTAAPQGTSYENGTEMRGNWVHDNETEICFPGFGCSEMGIGLFTDDDSSFIVSRDNVVYGSPTAIGGCTPVGHLTFTENFLDQAEPGWGCGGDSSDVVFADNALLDGDPEQACAAIPECQAVMDDAGLEPGHAWLLAE